MLEYFIRRLRRLLASPRGIWRLVSFFLAAAVLFFLFDGFERSEFSKRLDALFFSLSGTSRFTAFAAAIASLAAVSFAYLSDDVLRSTKKISDIKADFSAARERAILRSLADEIGKDHRGKSIGYEEMRVRMLDDQTLQDELLSRGQLAERVVNSASKALEKRFGEQTSLNLVDEIFESTVRRLEAEIVSLNKRSTFNLVLGFSITATALGVLGLIAFNAATTHADLRAALLYFLPRVSISIFIEVFAFFFLRLYRASLVDIKYYQNQLTHVAKCRISVTMAMVSHESAHQAVIISALCQQPSDLDLEAKDSPTDDDSVKKFLELATQALKAAASGKNA